MADVFQMFLFIGSAIGLGVFLTLVLPTYLLHKKING